jgi:alkylhydroperoxidase family enzyme
MATYTNDLEKKNEDLEKRNSELKSEVERLQLSAGEWTKRMSEIGERLDNVSRALAAFRLADLRQREFVQADARMKEARDLAHEANARMVDARDQANKWNSFADQAVIDYHVE